MSLLLIAARARMNHQAMLSAPRRYWRIWCTANNGYPSGTQLVELELRATAGGANQADVSLPGVATSSSGSFSGSFLPQNAADHNTATAWFNNISPSTSNPQWWLYDAGTPITVNEIAMMCTPPGGANANISMMDFKVQSSADGAVWADEWIVAGSTGWSIGENRVFTRP